MYFYNFLLLISNILILTIHTQSEKPKGPGISGCSFLANVDGECGKPAVNIKDIPEECSSIIYFGTFVDIRYNVLGDLWTSKDNELVLKHLDEILKAGKPTYVFYGHNTPAEWTKVLACEASNGGVNSLDEMKGLKAFMDEHPGITGLIIYGLEYDSYSIPFPEFSQNFKKYLEVMKTSFPSLEIGFAFESLFLINQATAPKMAWLDFKVIDSALDFYIVSQAYLNDCQADLISTGIAPVSSSSKTTKTLEKVKDVLTQAGIPKEKTYFYFRLNPINDPADDSYTRCNLTVQDICSDKSKTSGWCSDTLASFNEKGKFAKENGVGFVTTNIDLNDPTNICKCAKPFPSFYALLDGFNNVVSPPCTSFSRS